MALVNWEGLAPNWFRVPVFYTKDFKDPKKPEYPKDICGVSHVNLTVNQPTRIDLPLDAISVVAAEDFILRRDPEAVLAQLFAFAGNLLRGFSVQVAEERF